MSAPFAPAQGSPEWLEQRRTCIGSSDAAKALGLAPSTWKDSTPLAVYRDKRGESEPRKPTLAMMRGTAMEPVIATLYEESQGVHLLRSPPMVRHAEHSWMGASFDGLGCPEGFASLEEIIGAQAPARLVEFKSVSYFASHSWGHPGTDQAPDYCLIQVQHQLEVLHSLCPWADPVAHVVALVEGEEAERIYPVRRDPDLARDIMAIEHALWQRIQAGTPPPPSTGADVELLFKRSEAVEVVASPELVEVHRELVEVRTAKKSLADRENELKDEIKLALGEADTLVGPDGEKLVTWRTSKPTKRLDQKAPAAAHPEIIEEFTTEGKASRPFLVKEG